MGIIGVAVGVAVDGISVWVGTGVSNRCVAQADTKNTIISHPDSLIGIVNTFRCFVSDSYKPNFPSTS